MRRARWNAKKKKRKKRKGGWKPPVSGWDFIIEADGKMIGRGSGYPDREKAGQGATVALRDQAQRGRWGWQIVALPDDIGFRDWSMPNALGIKVLPGGGVVYDYLSRPIVVITIRSPRTRELMPKHTQLKDRLAQADSSLGDIGAMSAVEREVRDGLYESREIAIQAYGIRPDIARLGWSERMSRADHLQLERISLMDQISAMESIPA